MCRTRFLRVLSYPVYPSLIRTSPSSFSPSADRFYRLLSASSNVPKPFDHLCSRRIHYPRDQLVIRGSPGFFFYAYYTRIVLLDRRRSSRLRFQTSSSAYALVRIHTSRSRIGRDLIICRVQVRFFNMAVDGKYRAKVHVDPRGKTYKQNDLETSKRLEKTIS